MLEFGGPAKQELLEIMARDCNLMNEFNLMDYSFLIAEVPKASQGKTSFDNSIDDYSILKLRLGIFGSFLKKNLIKLLSSGGTMIKYILKIENSTSSSHLEFQPERSSYDVSLLINQNNMIYSDR